VTTDLQRAAGYEVLAQLLLHGAADIDPELARLFDSSTNPDALRSEYVAAFDLGVPPFASVFLEADRCVGGHVTTAIGDRMGASAAAELGACHLAAQLKHVTAVLAARQWAPARLFVHDVVLAWLPSLSVVLAEQPVPFWNAVVRQALDLAADHAGREAPGQWSMPMRPAEVACPLEAGSGLADIASWLTTPAAVGTFIADHDIVTIARDNALPRGFGSRAQRLETLLRAAADYEVLVDVARGLAAILERRRGALRALAKTHLHEGLVAPWFERLDSGLRVTTTLREAVLRSSSD
jgi:TorA maturation chaperone TorD